MKTPPYRNHRADSDARRSPSANRSTNTPRASENRRIPPIVSHRRYPSLYQDFEPLFQRKRTTSLASSADKLSDRRDWKFPYVRVFALLVIVAIIAALAANS